MFAAKMTPEELIYRSYSGDLTVFNAREGEPRERIEQARTALVTNENDLVLPPRCVPSCFVHTDD